MEKRNFNEALKQREERERQEMQNRTSSGEKTLDDATRVKVLSPGMMVFKRFIRNKLAIVGSAILIFMFVFSFLGPYFYEYGQTQVFSTYKPLNVDYGSAIERTENTVYEVDTSLPISATTKNMFNSLTGTMEENGQNWTVVEDTKTGATVIVEKLGENIYTMESADAEAVGSFQLGESFAKYSGKMKKVLFSGEKLGADFTEAVTAAMTAKENSFEYQGKLYLMTAGITEKDREIYCAENGEMKFAGKNLGEDFKALVAENLQTGVFEFNGQIYTITAGEGAYNVNALSNRQVGYISSTFVFDTYVPGQNLSNEFKTNALLAIYGEGKFSADGVDYTVKHGEEEIMVMNGDQEFAALSTFVVRRYNGEDSLTLGFKAATRETVAEMEEAGVKTGSFSYEIPQIGEDGMPVLDENGNSVLVESEITLKAKPAGGYDLNCEQITYMLDRYSAPSKAHPFGTDGDGMDVLARMMAGGRVSLLVGFVVIILEMILGVIMGGIAGYFGGWVDNLIMRLVDIFYCIPSMPILIIMGAMLDSMRVPPYTRLMWLMAILGFLGWAGIARLVRGQILSLREQDFMVATEASGLPVRRRIFRHLIPNVMPQLIVNATMGLGGIILTESTLSFLGLGVKHPMATWGTMINSVAANAQAMIKYTYIWIPVGMLICLTVIAFNFVGDGLRDAFDPKMKR